MIQLTLTPGLLGDAELTYRREQVAADMASARRVVAWVGRLRRRSTRTTGELVLAA